MVDSGHHIPRRLLAPIAKDVFGETLQVKIEFLLTTSSMIFLQRAVLGNRLGNPVIGEHKSITLLAIDTKGLPNGEQHVRKYTSSKVMVWGPSGSKK